MPLDSTPLDPNLLPVVVCGPIIRRLTRTSVSVWVALSRGSDVTLDVTQAGNAIGSSTETPVRVGVRLWLSVLTVTLNGAQQFQAGTLYNYDLSSPQWPAARTPDWQADGYTIEGTLPSFIGLPNALDTLRIVHASCRKPHGGGADGLALAARDFTAPGGSRIHQLLLTGDQIYSDDVASPLMPRVRRVAHDLIGDRDQNALAPTGRVGDRQSASEAIGLTSSAAANHLWGFSEFAAMYLLAWSDELWPTAPPTFSQVDPAVDFLNGFEVPEASWNKQRNAVIGFQRDLSDVKKLLANAPTLMVFDDHEVTDDWNLDRPWCENIYANSDGKRVLANGLLAYTLFQHWGNVPQMFRQNGSPERAILTAVASVATTLNSPVTAAVESRLGFPSLPFVPGPVVMRDANNNAAIRFDFTIEPADGLPCRLIFLDERTMRSFPTETGPCQRVSTQGLGAMMPGVIAGAPQVPTLVVAAAPVFGFHFLEHVLQKAGVLLAGDDGPTEFDLESWTAHRPALEALLDRISTYDPIVFLSGDVHYGFNKRFTFTDINGNTISGAQLTASSAKNADTKTMALHTFGAFMMGLNIVRTRQFDRYQNLTAAQRSLMLQPPPVGSILPWDDTVDIALGRVARRSAEQPAVFSHEMAQAYNLPAADVTYTVRHQDDVTLMDGLPELLNVINQRRTGQWNVDDSLQIVRVLQRVDLLQIGRVFMGLPQAGVIQFPAGPEMAVSHRLLMPVGDDPVALPDQTSVTVVTPLVPMV